MRSPLCEVIDFILLFVYDESLLIGTDYSRTIRRQRSPIGVSARQPLIIRRELSPSTFLSWCTNKVPTTQTRRFDVP